MIRLVADTTDLEAVRLEAFVIRVGEAMIFTYVDAVCTAPVRDRRHNWLHRPTAISRSESL